MKAVPKADPTMPRPFTTTDSATWGATSCWQANPTDSLDAVPKGKVTDEAFADDALGAFRLPGDDANSQLGEFVIVWCPVVRPPEDWEPTKKTPVYVTRRGRFILLAPEHYRSAALAECRQRKHVTCSPSYQPPPLDFVIGNMGHASGS